MHGERGSLTVPDPNQFDGDVEAARAGRTRTGRRCRSRPATATPPAATGWPTWSPPRPAEPRAGGRLACHVLEVMESLLASARSGQRVDIESRVERPPVVPLGDGPFVG